MKITFQSEGGFGFFPGLNKPLVIETGNLAKKEGEILDDLIRESVFDTTITTIKNTGYDQKEYKIAVEDNKVKKSIKITDQETHPKLLELLTYLKKKQREPDSGSADLTG